MPNPIKPPAPLLYCNKTLFGHKLTSLQKVLENANKAIGKSTKFINKIKSRQIAYAKSQINTRECNIKKRIHQMRKGDL
jgi:hypothetical protein